MRLYLFLYGTNSANGNPYPGYLIQTDDGTNVLVDTGFPPESDRRLPNQRPSPACASRRSSMSSTNSLRSASRRRTSST